MKNKCKLFFINLLYIPVQNYGMDIVFSYSFPFILVGLFSRENRERRKEHVLFKIPKNTICLTCIACHKIDDAEWNVHKAMEAGSGILWSSRMFLDIRKSGLKRSLENWHFLAILENNNENLPLEMLFFFIQKSRKKSILH